MLFANRRAWHIGDVMSVVTGYTVSPRGVEAVNELTDYLMGQPLTDRQREEYSTLLRQVVLQQYPELLRYDLDLPIPEELVPEWLRRRAGEFGEYLPLKPLHEDHPAIAELNRME